MRLPPQLHFLLPSNWPSLRARMTISYVAVTIGSVFSFILLGALARGAVVTFFSGFSGAQPNDYATAIQQQAQSYAMLASLQAQGTALDPRTNFIPGQAHTIALVYQDQVHQNLNIYAPYITATDADPTQVAIALLVAPDNRLVASSYPARYPAGLAVSSLMPEQTQAIDHALAGRATSSTFHLRSTTLGYAAQPVWSATHQPIGAIFFQMPLSAQSEGSFVAALWDSLWNTLLSNLLLLILVTPVGLFFGWVTTRSLGQRLRRLVLATTQFDSGDYTQRVTSPHRDEIGQLEQQFNQMAGQLAENIERRQRLAEENARLEERSRISRELHDAISQDLFSLRMLSDGLQEAARAGSSAANLRPHIALLEQTTGNMTREMRALLLELRPAPLEHLGLASALQELANAYSTRLGITVTTDVRPVTLDVKTEHALLRIAQEALANAARHSNATLISLSLTGAGTMVQLTITDNGQGFDAHDGANGAVDANDVPGYGLGLRIMQERVEELHGTFALTTEPGQGTRVAVSVPQAHQESAEHLGESDD